MVATGQKAPDFEALDAKGETVKLGDFAGRKVVLYFYPRDDTPGCTIEACAFRDDLAKFKKAGVEVLGVSMDSVESHQKFAEKFGLPFRLLADPDGKIVKAYGVYGEKTFYGKKFMGVFRTTFLIDETGKIARIWEKVKPEGHAKEVLDASK